MSYPEANVVQLPGRLRVRTPKPRRAYTPGYRRRLARQQWSAAAVGAVAVVLTGLSLSHLAHGIELVTFAPTWEAWSMAVGIDLGFIALELSQLCAASAAVRREISRFTKPAIVGTLAASALMNAFAFGSQASGLMVVPAVALGIAVPALIYALSRVAFGLSVTR